MTAAYPHADPGDRATRAESSVGIRALKQNASAVIARVAAGETIQVTDRGRAVAEIVPLRRGRLQQLVESGRLTEPTRPLSGYSAYKQQRDAELRSQGIPLGATGDLDSGRILDDLREERL